MSPNPQQEAVALWKYYESRGFKPTVRLVGRALREQGMRFRDTDLRTWLDKFRTRPGRKPDATRTHETSTGDATGTQAGRKRDAASRATKVSLLSETLDRDTNVSLPAKPAKKVRSPKFDFNAPENVVAKDFLDAIRSSVQPTLVGITWTRWLKANRHIAVDMAKAGVTYEAMLEAWEAKSRALGGPCRSLKFVQDSLSRGNVVKGPWPSDEPEFVDDGIPSILDFKAEK